MDTIVSTVQGLAEAGAGRWVVLVHQLPAEPAYARVKVRRRLQKLGAVLLRNSVYVLPASEEAEEDLQWLRAEIEADGGYATIARMQLLDGTTDDELERLFRKASAAEYRAIVQSVRSAGRSPSRQDIERLGRQLTTAMARDYFEVPERGDAERAVLRLEQHRDSDESTSAPESDDVPLGATWVTRANVFVDRIACAWLIRRFIDPAARFRFVDPESYRHRAGERRFDMFEGEYTHDGDRCTFETLLQRFALDDPSLTQIAEIVHDIDCKDDKFARTEATGVAAVLRGIRAAGPDDASRLEAGRAVFEGLYEQFAPRIDPD